MTSVRPMQIIATLGVAVRGEGVGSEFVFEFDAKTSPPLPSKEEYVKLSEQGHKDPDSARDAMMANIAARLLFTLENEWCAIKSEIEQLAAGSGDHAPAAVECGCEAVNGEECNWGDECNSTPKILH